MKRTPTVGHHMVPCPITIGRNQTLVRAHEIMRDHNFRHLPVLDGGDLIGLISERDLFAIETFATVDPKKTTVEKTISPTPYTVGIDTPLSEVLVHMAKHHYGCALVTHGDTVVGIFTTTDAVELLSALLESHPVDAPSLRDVADRRHAHPRT